MSAYSPSHFHRVFAEIVGETPADYVKRLRLERAAHFLIYEPHMPVTEIAMYCGFSSLSYFTYSFTEYFKHSPKGAYLKRFPREYLHSKKSKQQSRKQKESEQESDYTGFQWLDLTKVQTVVLEEQTVMFARHLGPYTQGITDTWENVFRYAKARDLISKDTMMLGVPCNNPYITPVDKCRYDCCIAVTGDIDIGHEMDTASFKGGKHVLYPFEEAIEYNRRDLLIECYSELYSFWLPRSGYRYLGNPVELISIASKPGTLDLDCRITAIALAIEPK